MNIKEKALLESMNDKGRVDIYKALDIIIKEAKKEMFDDIEENYWDFGFPSEEANRCFYQMMQYIKKRHLSTFANGKSDIINVLEKKK